VGWGLNMGGGGGGVELGEDFSLEWGQTQKYKNTKTQTNNHRQILNYLSYPLI
jgi:hypothetical protein